VLERQQKTDLHIKIQSVPRSKRSVSVIKASRSVRCREVIAVCSEIHIKHTNTLCGQNVELLNVKLVVHIVTTGLYKVCVSGVMSMHCGTHKDSIFTSMLN
jgi:hypothetical protein